MTDNNGTLDTLVQQKLEADTEFNASLESMSDEDKNTALSAKKTEIIEAEIVSLREKSEKATKTEELANNYKVRAEKAEAKLNGKGGESKEPQGELTTQDVLFLSKADVHQDDMERVIKFAKDEKISIKQALSNDDLKAILDRRVEVRKTAAATQTKSGVRGSTKNDSAEILAKSRKGEVPTSQEDIDKLVNARWDEKRKKADESKK
jgi:hypothetical protein